MATHFVESISISLIRLLDHVAGLFDVGFGGEGEFEKGVDVLLVERLEEFLQGHGGDGQIGDVVGGEFEEF